jgi:hypothetical protein
MKSVISAKELDEIPLSRWRERAFFTACFAGMRDSA